MGTEMRYANLIGWTDTEPYEIVRTIGAKTIEIRAMDAERIAGELGWIPGGFAGHCTAQAGQQWKITSNPSAPIIRARLHQDGRWYSVYGRHALAAAPCRFYDFNF